MGYSALNDHVTTDTGVYERSYFFSANRPLYTASAKFTGGLMITANSSVNIYSLPDSVYRNYQYNTMDVWVGFNFRNQFKNTGLKSNKPNLALLFKQYNSNFTHRPWQPIYKDNPNYNDNHYFLSEFALFHQDFFKTNYFFGFGKTEDIPSGYNASATFGLSEWVLRQRTYSAVEAQKYWLTPRDNLFSTSVALGSFFYNGQPEDAVLHLQANFYSNLWRLRESKFRQFFTVDYLNCLNPVLYKPLNINRDNGILGYRNTTLNGYQRVNLSSQTTLYSPMMVYGFKFNFYSLLQASMLSNSQENIFKSPFYSSVGLGVNIRNENLSFNTLQISASYLPPVSGAPNSYFIQVTSTSAISFNIFGLTEPRLIPYR